MRALKAPSFRMSLTTSKRIFVALSGGVDSAVSAYLLKQQGHKVKCVFMKNWTGTHDNLAGECNWTRERDDAAAVARKLKLPFAVWDFERDYRKLVIDHFFQEYARGRTPNPDVRCNQYVKIPLFLKRALNEGADLIATGHYARVQSSSKGKFELKNGLDESKDQSYFLYTLTQSQLKHLVFPVGDLNKIDVRKVAGTMNLPVAEKPDSVGICFVGEVQIEDFLRTRLPENPGPIVNTKGGVLGQHIGLAFYTLGQRHGLGLSRGPWYVIGRKWKKNILIVGNLRDQSHIMASRFRVEKTHWVSGIAPTFPTRVYIRHRYRAPLVRANVLKNKSGLTVICEKQQRAITPGQSAVLYIKHKNDLVVIGGGVISKVEKSGLIW